MTDKLEELRAIDSDRLLDVVRQDQRSTAFEITDWRVEPLSDKGASNPDGLFCFSGVGRDAEGEKAWTVVLKILKDDEKRRDPTTRMYWLREYLAFQSGLPAQLPRSVVVPRCYGAQEREGEAWIWMELVRDYYAGGWALPQWAFAAHELGRFNGAVLAGHSVPAYPWFGSNYVKERAYLFSYEGGAFEQNGGWENPTLKKHLAPGTRAQVEKLLDERGAFLDCLDRLPHSFMHLDTIRRNLFIRQRDDRDELVLIDWGCCGIGAIGEDLASLVGISGRFWEWDPAQMDVLDATAYEAYLAGMAEAGWRGDPDLVRLGCDLWHALCVGVMMPPVIAIFCMPDHREFVMRIIGREGDELAAGWAALTDFGLRRAEVARQTMKQMRLG